MAEKERPGETLQTTPPAKPEGHEECEDTDCQVCMRMTIPQHIDSHGSKLEDVAGTGEYEVLGG